MKTKQEELLRKACAGYPINCTVYEQDYDTVAAMCALRNCGLITEPKLADYGGYEFRATQFAIDLAS